VTRIALSAEPMIAGDTVLRPWRDSDVASVAAACQDAEIARWTRVPENYSEADARAFLLYRHDSLLAGTTAPFAITSPDDRLLGSVSLLRLDWRHLRGEVGYWLARDARGHGHATRAVGLLCAWGFSSLGLERIALLAATGNRPSQLVAERCGFTREALLRAYFRAKHGFHDMVAYGLLRTDSAASYASPSEA
jgi:RimJ/RimL family protein N-acetyltransferase